MRWPVAVGVDVGGTKVLGVLVDFPDPGPPRVRERVHAAVATAGPGAPHDVAGQVATVCSRLVAASGGDVVPVGIGVAGHVDRSGAVVRSPNVPQAIGVDLIGAVRDRTGIDAVVENDANCVAIAALAWRRPGVEDLVAITFGTGIGGGFVTGGRLIRGANGFAGEPGHMVIETGGRRCACGQRGCWERYASGTALGEMADGAMAAGRIPSAVVAEDLPDRAPGNGERMVEWARRGDAGAVEVMREYAGYLALGLANLVNLLDPQLVVVSGGVARALDVVIDPVRTALASNPTIAERIPPIEVAPFAEAAGAVGAATAAALEPSRVPPEHNQP